MIRARKIKHFLILLSLPFMLSLYYNQVTNWHLHVNDSGIVVKHAHPYKSNTIPGTPFQKHHHSHLEFSILALLFTSFSLFAALLLMGFLFIKRSSEITNLYTHQAILIGFETCNSLRGPPCTH